MNLLYSKGHGTIFYDEYKVAYSEDKKELLSFPNDFHKIYYKVIEGCEKISEGAFDNILFINYCTGAEFIKNNPNIQFIKELNASYILTESSKIYVSSKAKQYISTYLNSGMSLPSIIAKYFLFTRKLYAGLAQVCMMHYKEKDLNKGCLCALELPNSIYRIEEKSLQFIKALNACIVPKGEVDYFKILLDREDLIESGNYCISPYLFRDVYIQYKELNWKTFEDYYQVSFKKYVEDITLWKHIENNSVYPIILLPHKLHTQLYRRFEYQGQLSLVNFLSIAKKLEIKEETFDLISPPSIPPKPSKETIINRLFLHHLKYKWWYIIYGICLKSKIDAKYKEQLLSYKEKEIHYTVLLKQWSIQQKIIMLYEQDICSNFWKDLLEKNDIIEKKEIQLHTKQGGYEFEIFRKLKQQFPEYIYRNYKKGSYYPDIIVNINNNFYIDIEVDEPYTLNEHQEIHYIGGEDDSRNEYFVSENWTVIRFTEYQIKIQCQLCVEIVSNSLVSTKNRLHLH